MRIKKFNEISSYSEYGNTFDREGAIDELSKIVISDGELGVYYNEMVTDLKRELQSLNDDDLKMIIFVNYLNGEIEKGNVKSKDDIPSDFNIEHYKKAVRLFSKFQEDITIKYTEKYMLDKYPGNIK